MQIQVRTVPYVCLSVCFIQKDYCKETAEMNFVTTGGADNLRKYLYGLSLVEINL